MPLVIKLLLALHVLQDINAPGNLHHGHDQTIFSERDLQETHIGIDHLGGAVKGGYLERLAYSLPFERIKSDTPHVDKSSAASRGEVDRPAIRRPAWLIVPGFAVRNVNPLAACRRRYVNCGETRLNNFFIIRVTSRRLIGLATTI